MIRRRRWKSVVILALALAMVFGMAGPAFAQEPPEMVKVIIGFNHEPAWGEWWLVRNAGGKINHDFDIINAYAATVPQWAISHLNANPNVAYVEIDGIVHAIDEALPWGVDRIDADEVWDTNHDLMVDEGANTGDGIKVAIIDTGIDYDHPDLAANYGGGYDFVNNDDYPMDDNGHGTHVAGIVAAIDNDIGVIGVAPEAELYAVKVLDSSGSGYVSDVVAGIDWAIVNGMQIISMSLGTNTDYVALREASDNAYSAGLLVVAAAGNDGSRWSTRDTVDYPARYDSVIAVAATNQNDQRAVWGWRSASSTGPDVELAAPGDKVYSTYLDDTYATGSGTSMACPHVAGVAALVIAAGITDQNGNGRINDEVRARLQATAEDLGAAGRDNEFGYGLVDAEAAAAPPLTPNEPPIADADGPYTGTEDVAITFNGSGSYDPDGDTLTYKWNFGDETQAVVTTPTTTHTYTTGQASVNITYTVALVVNDGKVDSDSATTTATVTGVNDAPAADAGGPYSGVVDEPITFDGSGSSDEEGAIDSYTWYFGDGNITEVATATTTHTYSAVGAYTVTLAVTDHDGATGTDTATAEVKEAGATTMHVADIEMGLISRWRGWNVYATATVAIVDASGNPVSGATVSGEWSGATSDSDSGVTNGNGKVTLQSNTVRRPPSGTTFTFTVTDVTKDGWSYNPDANVETSDSITK